MVQACWNGTILAENDRVAHVEGNAYFPMDSVSGEFLRENNGYGMTFCHWKGFAAYYDVVVNENVLEAAAWRYDAPYPQAELISDHIAFWRGVEVIDGPEGRGYVEPIPSLRDGKTGWEALCWVLRHPPKTTLDALEIFELTDISENGIRDAWETPDVQRYATRYRWTLMGGDGAPVQLTRAEGEPVTMR